MSGLRPGNRHVMLLWAASAGNQGASWIMLVAVFVYVLHHYSASSLAIVELVGTLPALLCMPFAGAMADRHDVRRLALGSMLVQALCLLGVLVMLKVGLWEIAACYGLQGAAGAVWPPARQRWLYALVREERGRAAANAAIGSVSGVMTIAGAALGGVLSAWSTSAALAAAAGLQLAATVPLLALARPAFQQGGQAAGALRSLHADLAEGFTALRTLPLARSVIWIGIAWGLIGGAYNVLLAAHVTNDLHGFARGDRGQDRRRPLRRSLRHCRGHMVVAERAARPSSLYERDIRSRHPGQSRYRVQPNRRRPGTRRGERPGHHRPASVRHRLTPAGVSRGPGRSWP